VKYLTVSEDGPAYRELRADHIDAVPRDVMASVEALSGPAGKRRTAKVVRGGETMARSVSSAHCGPFTAAGQSHGRLGIDLERIETRRPEFYRQMFSDRERAWVEEMHLSAGASKEAAFTLLWGVKEAFLKASNWPGLTVWNFSHWSACVGSAVVTILQPEAAADSINVPGCMESAGVAQPIEVSARRVGDMLLVTVQYDVEDQTESISL
jgi:phosphopantetheinyl transferase (holo-ACP synthase)